MSDVQARRDARRRRILENADNRLKLISSRDDNSEEPLTINSRLLSKSIHSQGCNSDSAKTVNARVEPAKHEVAATKKVELAPTKKVELAASHDRNNIPTQQPVDDNTLRTIFQNPVPESTESVSEIEFINFEERRSQLREWLIVLLALVMRYFFLCCEQYPHFIGMDLLVKYHLNKVFVPFFVYEITEYFFFKPFIPQSGLLNMIFMLNLGIRTENLHKIVMITRIICRLIQDMMIFVFAFVCIDQVITTVLQV